MPQDILRIIARYYPMGNRQLYDYLYGKNGRLKMGTLSSTLSRMKKKGLLRMRGRKWSIAPEGRELLASKNSDIKKFFPNVKAGNEDKERCLIIIFDIPEKKKRYREWLRSELVGFGFDLIQKSVWFGPALPKEFVKYLDEIRLLKHIRFFRATEKDLI
jgi:DNA-binding transcriptional regulator PaaX